MTNVTQNELCALLRGTPLFANVKEETVRDFAKQVYVQDFARHTDLFEAGDPADCFFLIVKGWVKLYRLSREGDEIIINVVAPSETFAEAAVFCESRQYPVNAQAVEDTTVLKIPRELFIEKIRKDNEFALRVLGTISTQQRYLVRQLEQVTARSAPQRIGAFLLKFCPPETEQSGVTIDLPYDKSLIAARLSIQPETFSRGLAKLGSYGVQAQGRSVQINNPQVLADYCEYDWKEAAC